MSEVSIRLEGVNPAALDAHEAALRRVLNIPGETSRDYPNHRRGGRRDAASRRYLESTGVKPAAAAAPAALDVATDAKRRRDLAGEIGALIAADEDLTARPWHPVRAGDVVLMWMPADAHSPAYGETYVAVDEGTDVAGSALLRRVARTELPGGGQEEPPEYLLRFDTQEGCWALDAMLGGGEPEPWKRNPQLTDPAAVAEAKVWAHPHLGDMFPDPDELGHLEWRECDKGLVPAFVPLSPEPKREALTPFYDLWFEAGPSMLTVIRAGAVVHGTPARVSHQ